MVAEQADQRPAGAGTTAGTPMNLKLDWCVSSHARRLLYLALASLALAVVTRRPEFVAVAAPALALRCARRAPRPQSAQLQLRPSASRVYEGEQIALDVTVSSQGDHDVELLLHPSVGARVVRGGDRAASDTATLAFELTLWGKRSPGTLEVALWDRYRMFECRNFARLPEVVCYPVPAQHRRALVLGRLANRSGDHPARSPGEGAEFIIGLPRPETPDATIANAKAISATPFSAASPALTVLVIDDEESILQLIQEVLRREGRQRHQRSGRPGIDPQATLRCDRLRLENARFYRHANLRGSARQRSRRGPADALHDR